MRALLGSSMLLTGMAGGAALAAVAVDPDDIGGVVTGPKGPEAGVWVIAETRDLPTRFIRIVVTDDAGRYVLPDLPKAKYKVWVRGYGLVDSKQVDAEPGRNLDLTAVPAPDAKAAAEYYPANYWFSLIKVPGAGEFPGTGPQGNGISPIMKTQQDWIGNLKENCQFCHQLGTKATRELEAADSIEGWNMRVQRARSPDDPLNDSSYHQRANEFGAAMNNNMTRFGRERALKMFADWTDRIAKGALPPVPERPKGVERNVVVSIWDWGGGHFIHDSSSTDKRNPTVNAGGPVYGVEQLSGKVVALDPKTAPLTEYKLTGIDGKTWNPNINDHTSMMDEKGRYWMSTQGAPGQEAAFCTDASLSPYARYFGRSLKGGRTIAVFNPKTGTNETIPVCYSTHHLNFTHKGSTLFYSGDTEVVGWIDTKVWDDTHDAKKAVGWCPMVLDTSGDGRIDPDRKNWNDNPDAGFGGGEGAAAYTEGKGGAAAFDPKKDTRIAGFLYGMGISPKDDSFWAAKYTPTVPSGIVRLEVGAHPPETCRTEYYEAPKINGKYQAVNTRGVDVDANGVAWVAFGTGQIGSFDRSKCKVTNGPTATGQQCPEGWTIYDTPGPKLAGTDVGSDWFYLTFVDHHNASGLGAETPIFPGSVSDALLAAVPDAKDPAKRQMVELRVPYPLGYYPRGVDGRIDDPNAGWKGRGLWASNNILTLWHQEGGEEETLKMVKFQVRPDPLAH
jgi:hypothetical protein